MRGEFFFRSLFRRRRRCSKKRKTEKQKLSLSHRHFLSLEARPGVRQVGDDRHVHLLAVVCVAPRDGPVGEHRGRGDRGHPLRPVERGDARVLGAQRRDDARGRLRLRGVWPRGGLRVGAGGGHELGELGGLGGLEGFRARGVQGRSSGRRSGRRRTRRLAEEARRGRGERRRRPSPRHLFRLLCLGLGGPQGHAVQNLVLLRLRRRQRRRLGVVVGVARRELPRGRRHPVGRRGRLRFRAQRRRHGDLVARGRVARLREGAPTEELACVGRGLEGVGAGQWRVLARGEGVVCRDGWADS